MKIFFQKNAPQIHAYFKDIDRVAAWNTTYIIEKLLPPFLATLLRFYKRRIRKLALLKVGEYLTKNFKDARLKALLASQWGDYGVPPQEAAFAIHALIVHHYLNGGYFPEGGASNILKTIRPIIENGGGSILVGHSVDSLIIKNGTAIGVKATYENGPEIEEVSFYAPTVISNIGAVETYKNLLAKSPVSTKIIEKSKAAKGLSAVTVYLGLKDNPKKLDVHGENFWIYSSYDHDSMAADLGVLEGKPAYCYISFPSLKTPHPRNHTGEIIAFVDYDAFLKFKNTSRFLRDTEYYRLKEKITEGLIKLADQSIPGFKDLVTYAELSTPLSLENFTSRSRGLMYGIPATPERYRLPWLEVKTPIKDFLLTGSDLTSAGIVGALMGGVVSAAFLNGSLGFFKIIAAIKKYSKTTGTDISETPPSSIHPFSNETSARLVSRKILSSHFYEIILEVSKTIKYVPGQHVYLEIAQGEWRPYSIVSSKDNKLVFVIDSNPGGLGSRFAVEAPFGVTVNLRLPTGSLNIHDSKSKNLVFVATGSGVTPFFAMLQNLGSTHERDKKVTLLWGIRDESDEFSSKYLNEAAKQINLSIIPCVSKPITSQSLYHGNVTVKIRELQLDFKNTDFYLCGNPMMIAEMYSWLTSKGASDIYFEL